MKTFVLAAFALFVSMYNSSISQGTWTLDASHSRLGFKATHMGISETHGSFDKVTCTITTSNNNDFTDAVFDLTAETSSINTGLEARDNHLKSEDFFSVSKFPTLTFKSTSCKKVKGKKYLVKGNLSMHGVTKEVLIIATHNGNTKNRGGMDVAGFKFTSSFKRSDFGIGTELPFSIVADQVELSSDMEVVKN